MRRGRGQGARRYVAALVVAFAVLVPPATLAALLQVERWRDLWGADGLVEPVLVTHLLTVTVAAWGGALLVHRRPGNPSGRLAVLFGAALGGWYVATFAVPDHGWWPFVSVLLVLALRPPLLWLVLAWPTGHLDRAGRWLVGVWIAVSVGYLLADATFAGWDGDPIAWWHQDQVQLLVTSTVWDVGLLVISSAVLVACWRRRLRLRGAAAALARPGWWAAVALAVADLVLVVHGPVRALDEHNGALTPFGMTVQIVDLGARAVVVAVLVWGSRRAWSADPTAPVDLDAAGPTVEAALRRATGDPTVAVSFDVETLPGDGRATTTIAVAGEPVAVLHHAEELVSHPSLVESAAAAVAAQLEHERLAADADAAAITLRALGRELLDAEDAARQRLERDLHDGAQSTLVGLALQAALIAKDGGPDDATALADALDDVRASLLAVATGRPPALLAERGLSGAVGALAATAGLPVTVSIDPCDDLDPEVQRNLWFLVGDAVTNVLKHADATSLTINLERRRGDVRVTVGDDGRGGVSVPPSSLQRRVESCGGRVDVADRPGRGTTVAIVVPDRALVSA